MTKALIKYLIPIYILLLSIDGQLSAHMRNESASVFPSKSLPETCFVLDFSHPARASFLPSVDRLENVFYDNEHIEEEDDDDTFRTHKKTVCGSDIFTAFFYKWDSALFKFKTPKILHFCKHLLQFSPDKLYIAFCVFRI